MDLAKKQEDLSFCYLGAVCANKFIQCERLLHDDDSRDAMIKKVIYRNGIGKYEVEFGVQLKSATGNTYREAGNEIVYQLKVKNYNDLVQPASSMRLLFLFILPKNVEDWVNWTEKEILIRGNMYWIDLTGQAVSQNQSTVSVHIPKENIVNVDSIEAILNYVAERD